MDDGAHAGRILTREQAISVAAGIRRTGGRLVVTNGCFDLLHVGHVRYLKQARLFGDFLMIGLNTDASVRQLKGPMRPIVGEEDRAEVLASLRCVDYVTLMPEDTAESLVRDVRPHVYVKGSDYCLDNCPEARVVIADGGEARFIDLVPGRSSTAISARIAGM